MPFMQAMPALIAAAIVIVVFFLLGYVKAPPDVASFYNARQKNLEEIEQKTRAYRGN